MKLKSLDTAIKYIDSRITHYDTQISKGAKNIVRLKTQKEQLQKALEKYPDASYNYGALYLVGHNDKWNDVVGMSIDWTPTNQYRTKTVSAKFSLKNKNVDDIKIYVVPSVSVIAEITPYHRYSFSREAAEIKISEFKAIIPDECKRKKYFLKRIKKYILNQITDNKLTIAKNSFYEEEFVKLMLLK